MAGLLKLVNLKRREAKKLKEKLQVLKEKYRKATLPDKEGKRSNKGQKRSFAS